MINLENWRKAKKIDLHTVEETDGKLTPIEINNEIPFEVRRIFLIYDIPTTRTVRGNHASKNTEFFIQAIYGTAFLELFDGKNTVIYELNSLVQGVYVPPMTWIKIYGFSKNTIVQVCASLEYKNCKYINSYEIYMNQVNID